MARQGGGSVQQSLDFRFRQEFRQRSALAWRVQAIRGIVGAHLFLDQEAEELAQASEAARSTSRRQAVAVQAGQVGSQGFGRGQRRGFGAGRAKGREIRQVPGIGEQRVARRAALGGQHFDEGFDVAVGRVAGARLSP